MLRVNHLTGFGGGGGLRTLTFVASAVSATSQITIPATAQAGDLGVLVDYASGVAEPADVVPTDWTGWNASLASVVSGAETYKGRMSYKILVGGDPNTAITGMNGGDSNQKVMFVFRGNQIVTTITASTANGQATAGNPTQQSVTATAGTPPLVVIGAAAIHVGTAAFSTANPAFDGTAATADADLIMGYTIYNSAPADHTIDMNDLGDNNYLASGYLAVS